MCKLCLPLPLCFFPASRPGSTASGTDSVYPFCLRQQLITFRLFITALQSSSSSLFRLSEVFLYSRLSSFVFALHCLVFKVHPHYLLKDNGGLACYHATIFAYTRFALKIPRVNHAMNSLRNPLRDSHHAMNSLKLASLVKLNGGLKWTRTTDLTLIRRAL